MLTVTVPNIYVDLHIRGLNVQKKIASIFILSLLLISLFSPFYANYAKAEPPTYTLTINNPIYGSIYNNTDSVYELLSFEDYFGEYQIPAGQEVTLLAVPDPDCEFNGWELDNGTITKFQDLTLNLCHGSKYCCNRFIFSNTK